MKLIKRQFAKIVDRFWRKRTEFDWLQFEYEVMSEADALNEARINDLIVERDRLKKAKKRHLHVQAEIERLRTQQLLRV